MLCFQILTVKLINDQKCSFNRKLCFVGENVKNIILHVFTDLRLLMFHYNIVKILEIFEQVEHFENLHRNYLPYRVLHIWSHFYYGRK